MVIKCSLLVLKVLDSMRFQFQECRRTDDPIKRISVLQKQKLVLNFSENPIHFFLWFHWFNAIQIKYYFNIIFYSIINHDFFFWPFSSLNINIVISSDILRANTPKLVNFYENNRKQLIKIYSNALFMKSIFSPFENWNF